MAGPTIHTLHRVAREPQLPEARSLHVSHRPASTEAGRATSEARRPALRRAEKERGCADPEDSHAATSPTAHERS